MTAALIGIAPNAFIAASYPLTLAAISGGILWGLMGVPRGELADNGGRKRAAWRDLLISIWPLLLVILLVVILRLHMLLSLVGVIALFALVKRIGLRQWPQILRRSFPLRTFSAVFGVMIFKRVIEDAGAVQTIPAALGGMGLAPMLVGFAVPHLVGLLTGTPPAAIALSIPLVAPVMATTGLKPATAAVWMFVGTFSGIMLSPLHLCLALTREYFGAHWGHLYRLIAPATALVIAVAAVLVLWNR
jgi:integral membrane protein (TIGR00529 family)